MDLDRGRTCGPEYMVDGAVDLAVDNFPARGP
jgi:hypothetical protein